MKKTRQYRMYGLVPYNISPIQQGIQFGHAVVEYGLEHGGHINVINDKVDTYTQWAKNDKTFIILNGGTTNNNRDSEFYGTLNCAVDALGMMGILFTTFYEPDLGDQLTAVVFLVDERVWDEETYPDCSSEHHHDMFGEDANYILRLREFLSNYNLA